MTSETVSATPHVATIAPSSSGRFERLALTGSLVLVAVGMWWLAEPTSYPFGTKDRYNDMSLLVGSQPGPAAITAIVSGLLSAALLTGILHSRTTVKWLRWLLVAVSAAMAVTYGYLVPDITLLILVAYALTLSLPALTVFVVLSRRGTRQRSATNTSDVLRRALVGAALTLLLTVTAFVTVGRPWVWGDPSEPDSHPLRPVLLLASLLIGVSWAAVTVRVWRSARGQCITCGQPGARWTSPEAAARWGTFATWAAALTPLPYVLARLTWLTPWPYGESAEHLAAQPGLWVFGLGLAAAGEVGTWLTLSLIRRRGEVFPRWLPVWGDRSVPPKVAVVPGFAIALLMCVGGHSILQQAFGPGTAAEDHSLAFFVPLPLWGPLLALSTLAYWYRRRGACEQPGRQKASADRQRDTLSASP